MILYGVFMEKIKSFIKQNLRLILAISCGVLVVVGILVFIFLAGDSDGWLKGVFIAFGIVIILIGCVLLMLAALFGEAEKANFFLYDSKKKANIPLDELDFNLINRKMTYVMTTLASSAAAAWKENVFSEDKDVFADGDDAFVPLVAYKMLYGLAEKDVEAGWNCLENSSEETIKFICDALSANGDTEFAQRVATVTARPMNIKAARDYLVKCKEYMRKRMHMYVVNNIDLF
jgi:hypothetical protein